jgi:hypothetical protein
VNSKLKIRFVAHNICEVWVKQCKGLPNCLFLNSIREKTPRTIISPQPTEPLQYERICRSVVDVTVKFLTHM